MEKRKKLQILKVNTKLNAKVEHINFFFNQDTHSTREIEVPSAGSKNGGAATRASGRIDPQRSALRLIRRAIRQKKACLPTPFLCWFDH
jgi:hypothetical protein